MRDTLVHHLEEKLLIGSSQHGFRKGRSCLTNLLSFLDKVTDLVDSRNTLCPKKKHVTTFSTITLTISVQLQ